MIAARDFLAFVSSALVPSLVLVAASAPKAFAQEVPLLVSDVPISMTRDYKKVQALLERIQKENPATSEFFTLGTAGTGETIRGLKIGSREVLAGAQGSVKNLIVATHHGNEYGSTEVALGIAESLAKDPIKNQTVFVLPVLNVSGFNAGRREESLVNSGLSQLVDPNRDYPGPCGSQGPFVLKSTKALAEFVERENIIAAATLHTFYGSVTYPWGFSTPDLRTPDEALFINLGKAATELSLYEVGNSAEVIYPANGTFEDYAYWKHGIWSMLFELGSTHQPSLDQLKELVRVNVPGLRRLLENAPTSRAAQHSFDGRCDTTRRHLDRRDE